MNSRYFRVGELAQRTGISVRALHHYDALGLLKPMRDPQSRHRVYAGQQLERLQRIVALRQLGLTLEEIGQCLDDPRYSLRQVFALQCERLRGRLSETQRLLSVLDSLAGRLDRGESLTAEELLVTIEVTMKAEKYFTPEQRDTLTRRRTELGENKIRSAEKEWPELIAKVRAEMHKGTDPSAQAMQPLARRWRELVESFTGVTPPWRSRSGPCTAKNRRFPKPKAWTRISLATSTKLLERSRIEQGRKRQQDCCKTALLFNTLLDCDGLVTQVACNGLTSRSRRAPRFACALSMSYRL